MTLFKISAFVRRVTIPLLIKIKSYYALSARINFVIIARRLINAINAGMSLFYIIINVFVRLILYIITICRNVPRNVKRDAIIVLIALI